ncbi:ribosome recycling factor [candidate division WOR-3 bacterium]|uniref:Ribosome-recycling factor n=1 Tax=candidate division WOR-3 bacterium TaxID=2052148 RepID=A0A9D5QD16_UNCW3|nr:ribosome recycling factor [candidate division WOR-3 bacterium]MBD3365263.1 ribosome recycling factor [candidate division WOR-3 bacterium]
MKEALKQSEEKMKKTVEMLAGEFSRIRTARANPALLDGIKVDYYGVPTPLKQVASIGVPEPRSLVIQPWDKNVISEIEKALLKSDLGLNPNVEKTLIRISIPALTEERRKELVKLVSRLTEESRVAIRNIRRDAIENFKKMEKAKDISEDEMHRGQKDVQDLTDRYIKELDELLEKKEKEILEK